jgi:hypothetical protein
MDAVIKILGGLGGLIGTGLGIYNFVHARHQERHARAAEESDWQRYLALREDLLDGNADAWVPDEGSDEHRWAERMVAKGLLARSSGGAFFTLPRGT